MLLNYCKNILAFIFYSSERNWTIVILALIAGVSLIASHVKKSHFVYDKYMLAVLAGGFFFAVELVLSNSILSYYSGFTFYFLHSPLCPGRFQTGVFLLHLKSRPP